MPDLGPRIEASPGFTVPGAAETMERGTIERGFAEVRFSHGAINAENHESLTEFNGGCYIP
jgi:hypothetical protein